jgi:UDP-N-acetyl-D-mannosaminuronic acid dehydrogenase
MPVHLSDLVENILREGNVNLNDSTVVVLGMAYLENSDDTRNTPAAGLMGALQVKGASVRLHNPYVHQWEFTDHEIERDIYKAAEGADCLVLVTKHKEYFDLDFNRFKMVMNTPTIVDGRNIFNQDDLIKRGFGYRCVGKAGIRR